MIADNGVSAIEHLTESPPDALLLDLGLPLIDGIGVLHFVRTHEGLRGLPVVVFSNSGYFSGEVQAAWKAGATHFHNKADSGPFEVVNCVNQALGKAAINSPPIDDKSESKGAYTLPVSTYLSPTPSESTKSRDVLIADDDKLVHGVLKFFLEQADCTVRSVYDGKQALDAAIASAPDLLILDVLMPIMDGFQVVEHWAQHPVLCKIPVVMLTSLDDEAQRPTMAQNGVVEYIVKPFSPDTLVKTATDILDSRPPT